MQNITQRLEAFNKDRLPDMIQMKYNLMSQNIYRFYRGSCHLFYEDLHKIKTLPRSPLTWMCGDMHLENFGSYKGSNRLVYFDLNDFDEAILGHASWEVTRLVTSILIAFKSLKIEQKKAQNMARLFLKTYSKTLSNGKAFYIEPQTAKGIVCAFLKAAAKRKQKTIIKKRTEKEQDNLHISLDHPRHYELDAILKRELMHHVTEWIMYNSDGPYNYEVVDAAFRAAGTGSLGLKRYVFLLKNLKLDNDYLLVDMKQAAPSSLKPFIRTPQPAWTTEAERIATIQYTMQNIPPALLSTTEFQGDSFIVQELQSTKDSINFNLIKDRYRDIYQVIDDMAMLLASAQLRSSGRHGSATADELIAFGENNKWQDAILEYAIGYMKVTEGYYKEFATAYKKGAFKKKAAPVK